MSSQRRDPAWKYATQIEVPEQGVKKGYKYLKCNFCNKKITGGVKRAKDHLAGNHNNVAPCAKVPQEVKDEIAAYMNAFSTTKQMNQRNLDEMIDSGSYFGGASGNASFDGASSFPSGGSFPSGSRGVRGPMDRYMVNKGGNDDAQMIDDVNEIPPTKAEEYRSLACLDVGRFFYENAIPFNAASSPSYINMMNAVGNYGRGFKPPTRHELTGWILRKEVETTSKLVDDIKATWKKTGVSLLSDGWSDMRNRSLINFLVNNKEGTVFFKTVDASNCVKDANKLFELLDSVVEEIGEDIVVQVITDNASAYKAAGRLLMAKRTSLYWTPCAAHCIDLMLEKIGELPQPKTALLKAKRVSNFIHNHQYVLSLTRKFANKDLVRPAATRFATAYLTLESMYKMKQPLQEMFVSREWADCAWAKKSEGRAVRKIVMDDSFWRGVVYCMKTTSPLVHVLRLVDGEQTPAMAFLYGAMDEAKEKIAKNFDGDLSSYKEIWEIIDVKWNNQMHHDLHACAYYLNPQFKWSDNMSQHPEVKRGLYNCMERMIKDVDKYALVDSQLDAYNHKRGFFSHRAALMSYKTRSPVDWWEQFGDDVPELKSFATTVLGLTCSSSACERNWSTFNQVHTKKRNRLTTMNLNSLVYIMYNRRLKHKRLKKQLRKEDDDPLFVEDLPSDDEWVANPNANDEEDDSFEIEDEGTSSPAPKKTKKNQASNKGKGKKVQGLVDEEFDEELEYEGERERETESGDGYCSY